MEQLGGLRAHLPPVRKFDPAGARVAYLFQNDLHVEDLATHAITRLTDTGSPTLFNGTFDWVYEEEWSLRDGFRWSPDGESIAFWQIDAAEVGVFRLIDNTSGLYSRTTPIRYPKVGTTNARCRIGVIPSGGGEARWMDVPGIRRTTTSRGWSGRRARTSSSSSASTACRTATT